METMFNRWVSELTETPPSPVSDLSVSPPQPEATATDQGGGLGFPPCGDCFHNRNGGCFYRRWKRTGPSLALKDARRRCPMVFRDQ